MIKDLPLTAKFVLIVTFTGLLIMLALRANILYSRHKNATLEVCVSQIELGDSSAEVIEKMKPYRKTPDRILENHTIYYMQEEHEGFTLIVYDALFGDSGGYVFYFPPKSDSLIDYGPE